ncbi:dTDP-4-dehydrorhamnose reductase [Flavilitoribacter nigricans]|uniref:dTDP-4-dehydrorhamnose reductase n=1 Tax=Flavilitoribacter nigricans (strain ATCC 23147 / DSM 23189 / NBRC 102662 / NCIMB 1420 / SS-2) TaxID=1122177 RepID=A0A2D0N0N0_FLAN2|nr:dTDP-4-dehydrorhamnose reductase [Flavilitoribacter nigricans]PHN02017.1 dTDP-4-dehydrorhamnose reductase [Flavilitoribacter nigricans DSM 23189 = NBRC 102662]
MNICITGAGGQLGQSFKSLTGAYPQWQFHFADRSIADLSDLSTVDQWLEASQPDVLINCAAYTNVNQAEEDEALARQINVDAVEHLARYCSRKAIPLFHYSSDYVYHTERGIPFRETDATAPKGVYAVTKLEGERAALAAHAGTTVIRTSWVYASMGHNFVRTMLRLGSERDELKVVSDQIGTPTYAPDLAAASLQMLQAWRQGTVSGEDMAGIFNFSNEGVCSWYDFALAIFELSGLECTVHAVESHEFPSPVERPHYSVLNKTRIKKTFQLEIPYWREALGRCLAAIGQ